MLNFNGPDEFTFKVSNGISESRPALVALMVNPSAADTTTPQVSYTVPLNGATNVPVSATAMFTDGLGPAYHPVIVAQFSEPINGTTVSTQTVTLRDLAGRSVAIEVAYDAGANRLLIVPHEVLRPGTFYRVALANSITDLAGNRLPTDFSWIFQTAYTLYLPLLER